MAQFTTTKAPSLVITEREYKEQNEGQFLQSTKTLF